MTDDVMVLRDQLAAVTAERDRWKQRAKRMLVCWRASRDEWKRFAWLMDKCRRTMWRQVEEEWQDAAGVPRLKPTTTRIPAFWEGGADANL